jgi:pimeloyl-ACP methyl ester carboxylesterase
MLPEVRNSRILTNGVHLHIVEAGPQDGPLVILLHGFPEFWYGWRRQIPALAEAGFHVCAPDQRGYNTSDKPLGLEAFRLDVLAQDVLGLIDALGSDTAAVVGHDWGAAVAWAVALFQTESIQRLAILNVPHPAVMRRTLRRSLRQLFKSWYIAFFQLPGIAEWLLQAHNWRLACGAMQGSSRDGTFSDQDLEAYRRAWSQPGAIRAMLHWYRALVRRPPVLPEDPRIHVPTLMVWGTRDVALSREMAQPSIDLCDRGRLVFFESASHWVQHEEHEQVNGLLCSFLSGGLEV